ncbi:MAG: DUF953 domain-containing protein [Candidatus Micrarchaeota archaeon]|nr:DUF953 domain-containing protein [Candidatus Micrarchaeota archaeon]
MALIRISAKDRDAYADFVKAFREHEKTKRPMIAYFFGGEDENSIWCSWCRAAEPVFNRFCRENNGIDIYAIGVGSENAWKDQDSNGARTNPFFAKSPNVVSVPTLVVAAEYHNGFRITARVSVPEDPDRMDFDGLVAPYIGK